MTGGRRPATPQLETRHDSGAVAGPRRGQRCPGSVPWLVHRDRSAGPGGDDGGGGSGSPVWPEGAPSGRAARVARRQCRSQVTPGSRPSPSSTTGPLQPHTRTVQPEPPRAPHSDSAVCRAPCSRNERFRTSPLPCCTTPGERQHHRTSRAALAQRCCTRGRRRLVVDRPAVLVPLTFIDRQRTHHRSLRGGRQRRAQGDAGNEPGPDKRLHRLHSISGRQLQSDRSGRLLCSVAVGLHTLPGAQKGCPADS